MTLARALSKLGYCSRYQARDVILSGRVHVDGAVCRHPDQWVDLSKARIKVDAEAVGPVAKRYLMLNKPRGLVTTRADDQGRKTVYDCLTDPNLPWLSPVGRLDKASEGLLLFTNDTSWADRLLAPESHVPKTYHVQIDCVADVPLLRRLVEGTTSAQGEVLALQSAGVLRVGERNSWLELVLDEGKNRHIRRLLEAFGINVLRLIRVAIGPLVLGSLRKGHYRELTAAEVAELASVSRSSQP